MITVLFPVTGMVLSLCNSVYNVNTGTVPRRLIMALCVKPCTLYIHRYGEPGPY